VARTDSEAATLITSTIDSRDHAFILGATNPALQPLNDLMIAAENAGKSGDALQAIEDQWIAQAGLKLFNDAVIDTINAGVHVNKQGLIQEYLNAAKAKSNSECRSIAKGLTGVDIHFDWAAPRTREGYYRYQGGCQCAINRAIAYAPFADMIWMESKLPDYAQAKEFADGVHAVWPEQKYVALRVCRYLLKVVLTILDFLITSHPLSTGRPLCLATSKKPTSNALGNWATAGNSSLSPVSTPQL
jgi:isocitrate lyase